MVGTSIQRLHQGCESRSLTIDRMYALLSALPLVIYTLKSNKEHNALSMLTIANLSGKVLYVHLGMSYVISALPPSLFVGH
jgi:hypothetical protein